MQGDTILTIKQVAEKLQASESWVYKKTAAKILPHFRIGGMLRFSEKAVNDWLRSHHVGGCQKV